MSSIAASFSEWPYGVARLGAVCVVALTVVLLPLAVRDALEGNDYWADHNGALTYFQRSVPPAEAVGSQEVVEDARLWMPEDARYRIVTSPELTGPLQWAAPPFLAAFLLPRRQVGSDDAPWVFCFHCEPSQLDPGFEVLSDSGEGVVFGRVER